MPDIKKIRSVSQPKSDLEWSEVRKNPALNWYSFLARKVSIHITRVLIKTPITANQVTLIGTLIGFLGSYFILTGNYIYSIVGVLLLHLFSVLDHVDGEVARYKKLSSMKGLFLDGITADLVMVAALLSIGVAAFGTHSILPLLGMDTYGSMLSILSGALSATLFLLITVSSLMAKNILPAKSRQSTGHHDSVGVSGGVRGALVNTYLFFRADVNIFTLMLVFSVFGLLYLIPMIYSVLFLVMFAFQLRRSIQTLEPPRRTLKVG